MKIYLTTLLVFIAFFSYAQSDSIVRGNSVIQIGNSSEPNGAKASNPGSKSAKPRKSSYERVNAYKLGLLDALSGIYAFSYEHEFSDVFSLQGSIGLSGRNILRPWTVFVPEDEIQSSPNFNSSNDIADDDQMTTGRTYKLGWYVGITPKYYFSEDGFEGNYLYLGVHRRSNKIDAYGNMDMYGNLIAGNTLKEKESSTNLSIGSGRQILLDRICLDLSAGLGVTFVKDYKRDTGFIADNFGFSQAVVGSKLRESSGAYPFYEISLKIGFW